MAAPFPTSYFIGIGTAISNLGVLTELSGGSYARLACGFTGTAVSGLTQTPTIFVVATAPTPAVNSYYGAIFDSLTGGNLIAYWTWNPPYTGSLTAFPSTVINLVFNQQVSVALNLALVGGQGSSGSLIDAGAQIGTVNGNPMLAGSRLAIGAGGSLVAHLGQGQWVGSMDVQGTLYVASLASGNILTGITALAGGANSALTPVLSAFINKLTVCATLNDSAILAGPAVFPTGSVVMVTNAGAAGAAVFPDTGASINSSAANVALVVPNAKSAMFVRVGSLNWFAILSA